MKTLRLTLSLVMILLVASFSKAKAQIDLNQITFASKLDEQPSFKEGKAATIKFFAKNIRYPETQAEGSVTINFLVFENGTIGKPTVIKSMGIELKEEVLRVLKLSEGMWKPGKKDGKAVNTIHSMTFSFVINDGQKNTGVQLDDTVDVVITKVK